MNCEKLSACPFYNDKMPIDQGLGKLIKKKYCENDKTKCARYYVSTTVGKEHVPQNLYPNMYEEAEKIVKTFKKE
jgi:hypothetical protein